MTRYPAPLPPVPNDADDDGWRFLNVKQLSDYLQINEKKVYALASEGKLPGTKITGKWLFPRDLVDQWLYDTSHGGALTDRLSLAGSDDPLLGRLVVELADELGATALVSYTSTGTRLGLELLASRRADGCTVHWGPASESAHRHPALLHPHARHRDWVLVRAFLREQGLLVKTGLGDALDIKTLLQGPHRWVTRQQGAGSQRFLLETLAQHGMEVARLDTRVSALSEREAAASIAMDMADIAPGVRAAAREFGLDFVSAGWEAFDIVVYRDVYFRTLFQRLLDTLRSASARRTAKQLGGYDLKESGKLVWANEDVASPAR